VLGEGFYFHDTLRRSAALFGTLFNEIYIQRDSGDANGSQLVRVPLVYSNKDKMLARVYADPDLDKPAAIVLPRMAFEQNGFVVDKARRLPTLNRFVSMYAPDANKLYTAYSPVPITVTYRLYVAVKNVSDGNKIVEQIVPYFTPDLTMSVQLIDEIDRLFDVAVVLKEPVTYEDSFSGPLEQRRTVIYTLTFDLETYLFGPVKPKPIIKFSTTRYWAGGAGETVADAVANSSMGYATHAQPGLTANGEPAYSASDSVDPNVIYANSDFGYIYTSNAY